MELQIRIKCPVCGKENLDDVNFSQLWLEPRALKCVECQKIYVYEASLKLDVNTYKTVKN